MLRGVTPRRLGENVLATEHGERGTFHADGPYDLLRLLRCDLRCSLSPSAPEGRSGITGAYCIHTFVVSGMSAAPQDGAPRLPALVLIPCAYTEASRLCTQALKTHRVCHGLTDLWAYR